MIARIDLDHVAVATERQADAWPRYGGDLAGRWVAGGDDPGFSAAQVRWRNGMKLEVLQPHAVSSNDFLRRFLDANGPGPHHLTFKVGDLDAALTEAEAAGFSPVGVNRSSPEWQEGFLHPKQAHGVVVQLAWSEGDWSSPPPSGYPEGRTDEPAILEHVAHAVADLDAALALFGGLLGGEETGRGEGPDGDWVDLAWPGPGRIRLLTPSTPGAALGTWLGGRPGRVHHLAFITEDPGEIADARPLPDGTFEVPAEANLGVRLRLRPAP